MDYKTQVINSSDKRYQDMLSGTTEAPIRTELKVDSSKPYSTKRDNFINRMNDERKAFNNAIKQTQLCHRQRVYDKSSFGGVIITTVVFVLLMAFFLFAYIKWDLPTWTEETLLPATGSHISSVVDMENETIAFVIAMIGAVLCYLAGAICTFIFADIDSCLWKLVAAHIAGCIAAIVGFIVLRFLAFVIGYAIYYLLKPWGALILSAIAIIVILICGRDLESSKFKTQKWMYCLACLAVGIVTGLIVSIV